VNTAGLIRCPHGGRRLTGPRPAPAAVRRQREARHQTDARFLGDIWSCPRPLSRWRRIDRWIKLELWSSHSVGYVYQTVDGFAKRRERKGLPAYPLGEWPRRDCGPTLPSGWTRSW